MKTKHMQDIQTSLTAHRAALDGQKLEGERLRQQALEEQKTTHQQQLGKEPQPIRLKSNPYMYLCSNLSRSKDLLAVLGIKVCPRGKLTFDLGLTFPPYILNVNLGLRLKMSWSKFLWPWGPNCKQNEFSQTSV